MNEHGVYWYNACTLVGMTMTVKVGQERLPSVSTVLGIPSLSTPLHTLRPVRQCGCARGDAVTM